MDRRQFLKDIGLLTAGVALIGIPKGRSMVGWTRSREGLYVHKEYAMGFSVTQEMLDDDIYGDIFRTMYREVRVPYFIQDGPISLLNSGARLERLIT
jgi:hypothetical protein